MAGRGDGPVRRPQSVNSGSFSRHRGGAVDQAGRTALTRDGRADMDGATHRGQAEFRDLSEHPQRRLDVSQRAQATDLHERQAVRLVLGGRRRRRVVLLAPQHAGRLRQVPLGVTNDLTQTGQIPGPRTHHRGRRRRQPPRNAAGGAGAGARLGSRSRHHSGRRGPKTRSARSAGAESETRDGRRNLHGTSRPGSL